MGHSPEQPDQIDVEASYRIDAHGHHCCYVCVVERPIGRTARIIDTRHLTDGSLEKLVDAVNAQLVRWTYEEVLFPRSPF